MRALLLLAVAVAAMGEENKAEKPVRAPETDIERRVRELLKPSDDPGDWCKTPYVMGWPFVVPVEMPRRSVEKSKTGA